MIKREKGEETALLCSGRLQATEVVRLTESIAYLAADMSLRYGLAMADAIVYATGRDQNAEIVTGGRGFERTPGSHPYQVGAVGFPVPPAMPSEPCRGSSLRVRCRKGTGDQGRKSAPRLPGSSLTMGERVSAEGASCRVRSSPAVLSRYPHVVQREWIGTINRFSLSCPTMSWRSVRFLLLGRGSL